MLNALTIDVEEHFQVHAFETVINRSDWDRYPSRVAENTRRILRLLAEYNVHATFFVLGWVADRHPDLVREIAAAGHEIGTHGYWHELIYRQTPAEFAADLSLIARCARARHRRFTACRLPGSGFLSYPTIVVGLGYIAQSRASI